MEYILDVEKWRCGTVLQAEGNKDNCLGIGETRLLNKEGFMCCLGQFACQKGITPGALLNQVSPLSIYRKTRVVYDPLLLDTSHIPDYDKCRDSVLALKLMNINDSTETTIKEKIKLIGENLEAEGHTLKVIGELTSEGWEHSDQFNSQSSFSGAADKQVVYTSIQKWVGE